MTREIKLSLLLGFGLLLFVGVLVSDHLSAARSAGDPTFAPGDRQPTSVQADFSPGFDRLVNQPPDPLGGLTGGGGEPTPGMGEALARGVQRAGGWLTEHTSPPLVAFNRGSDEPEPQTPQPRETTTPPRGELMMGFPPGGSNDPNDPGFVRIHHVASDDTLWAIADRYYGDPTLHEALARLNRDRLTAGGHLRRGGSILIPTRERLLNGTAPEVEPVRTVRSERRGPEAYIVQRGDTLSEIAADRLGSAARWREILELNRDQLDEPEDLRVGMTLRIPGAAQG